MPRTLWAVLLALVLTRCDALSSGESAPFATLTVPTERVFVNGTTVVRSHSALASFAGLSPAEASSARFSEVDFERQMVLGVFYGGSLHTGCFDQVDVVESVRSEDGDLVVELGPLPDLGACRAVVHPFQMVIVDAVSPNVRFTGDLPR